MITSRSTRSRAARPRPAARSGRPSRGRRTSRRAGRGPRRTACACVGEAVVRVPVEVERLVRAPEARQVGRDAAEAGVAHRRDDLAPQVRPRRLAVPEDDRRPVALVEVREAQAVDLAVARLEREVRQALERSSGVRKRQSPGSGRLRRGSARGLVDDLQRLLAREPAVDLDVLALGLLVDREEVRDLVAQRLRAGRRARSTWFQFGSCERDADDLVVDRPCRRACGTARSTLTGMTQPGNVGSVTQTIASSGSPSSPSVPRG